MTTTPISRAAVIGAGSMGSGIAAHLANAGLDVLLLDVPGPPGDRDAPARAGVERQLQRRGFMLPEFAGRITVGNIEDDMAAIGDAEWIIEVVFEDRDVKAQTYRAIARHRNPAALVSSNTSTIPLAELTAGMDEEMLPFFAVTHFFNPPRIMRLLELVAGPDTAAETEAQLRHICEVQLGKVVIDCRDTPGFIANRIGTFWMAAGAMTALRTGVNPELADAVFSRPFGVPRTGVFGLFDYIGLQLLDPIWGGLLQDLPDTDAFRRVDVTAEPVFRELVDAGCHAGVGFYDRDGQVYSGGSYVPRREVDDPAARARTAREVLDTDSPGGGYGRAVFLETLRYCCETAPEIADTVDQIDAAMRLGYGWRKGPFQLADDIGLEHLISLYADAGGDAPDLLVAAARAGGFYPHDGAVLSSHGEVTAPREREGVLTPAQIIADARLLLDNGDATLHLRDDGIAVLTLHTPASSCSSGVFAAVRELAGLPDARAGVIVSPLEGIFSAGADLSGLAEASTSGDLARVNEVLAEGADAFAQLRAAPFPVVAAVRGTALGGGLEFVQHCDAAVIEAEARLGFPERHVGLFPGFGGTVRTLERMTLNGVDDPVRSAFDLILSARPTAGAHEAAARGLLLADDHVIMSADHVIAEALALAHRLAEGYEPPRSAPLTLRPADAEPLVWEDGTETDRVIARTLAELYTGTTVTPEELGEREVELASRLLIRPENAQRVEHMRRTRRPLGN